MSEYIGIDIGSAMVKAASVTSTESAPRMLRMGGNDPFLPLCLDTGTGEFGWSAHARRRLAEGKVISSYRDEIANIGSSIKSGGKRYKATDLYAKTVRAIMMAVSGTVDSVSSTAWIVPDYWDFSHWSLPKALVMENAVQPILVKESTCIAAAQNKIEAPAFLTLSMGYGGITAGVVTATDHGWKSHTATRIVSLSGSRLRAKIVERYCNKVIAKTRKDPKDYDEEDQRVWTVVDRAVMRLVESGSTELNEQFFGSTVTMELTRNMCAEMLKGADQVVRQLVDTLFAIREVSAQKIPIFAWGELASVLPIRNWLSDFGSASCPFEILPLDRIAGGAAKVSAMVARNGLPSFDGMLGGIRPDDGEYLQNYPSRGGVSAMPIIGGLPARLAPGGGISEGRVILMSEDGKEEIESRAIMGGRLTLGRSPQADWSLLSDSNEIVSGAHMVVLREGADFLIRDLDSSNGTYLNDERLTRDAVLKSGDRIRLGVSGPLFRFEN